jgi:hypothetical protein
MPTRFFPAVEQGIRHERHLNVTKESTSAKQSRSVSSMYRLLRPTSNLSFFFREGSKSVTYVVLLKLLRQTHLFGVPCLRNL